MHSPGTKLYSISDFSSLREKNSHYHGRVGLAESPWMSWPKPSRPASLCPRSTTAQRPLILVCPSTRASTACSSRPSAAAASSTSRKGKRSPSHTCIRRRYEWLSMWMWLIFLSCLLVVKGWTTSTMRGVWLMGTGPGQTAMERRTWRNKTKGNEAKMTTQRRKGWRLRGGGCQNITQIRSALRPVWLCLLQTTCLRMLLVFTQPETALSSD